VKRLYYDTCAFAEAPLMFALGVVGADRMLFGTDDPFIDADTTHVTRLPIGAAEKAAILGGNAARLLGLQ
jgi:aminocarboxymuconate-semialdehyde decarboxylase